MVVGHFGLGQQNVHVAWHAARHRVDGVLDRDAFFGEFSGQLFDRVLCTGHGQTITGHDDHSLGIAQYECGVVCTAGLDGPLLLSTTHGCSSFTTKAAQDDVEERAVHGLAHDVRKDGARGTHQRTGNDQHAVVQAEANARSRPTGVAVEHGHHHRHVSAADRDDDEHAHDKC